MKKYIADFKINTNLRLSDAYALLKLSPLNGDVLPDICPGQFVEVEIKDSRKTFLRRPISICNVDIDNNEIWLLIRNAGEGTKSLIESQEGTSINIIYPLGNRFSLPSNKDKKALLTGGGVGVAPMFNLGRTLKEQGYTPVFLLAAKKASDLLLLNEFKEIGEVLISTDDGSMGEKGLITQNSIFNKLQDFEIIYSCGPLPMMKGIATIARNNNIQCEVSLENTMACGMGACLCCVEDTRDGNVCVCKDGPIFNIEKLKW